MTVDNRLKMEFYGSKVTSGTCQAAILQALFKAILEAIHWLRLLTPLLV